jgi:DNA-directed RNA polymerase specialized sigma24 family protein
LANESELAARAVLEPSAFAAIYDHYFPKVYNYARYCVLDSGTADEIAAQVFESALTKIVQFRKR